MAASSSSPLNHGLIDGKDYALKLGASFQPKKARESYHLMRYDFKPASVDTSRPAEVYIGSNNECTVTIPNVHDSSTTTYKGGKKPCTKECILIIDKETGEITLERISSNIPLKKSRSNRNAIPSLNKNATKVNPQPSTTIANKLSSQTAPKQPLQNIQSSSQNITHNSTFASPVKTPNQGSAQRNLPMTKERSLSTKSTSGSDSSSSDSSDSDSETEKEMAADLERETFSSKTYEAEPARTIPTKSDRPFVSTLHSDLQLSDSNESDSD